MLRRIVTSLLLWSLCLGTLSALSFEDYQFLLTRTGFGATPAELKVAPFLSWEQAVDQILAGTRTAAQTAPPAWSDEQPPKLGEFMRGLNAEQAKAVKKEQQRNQREHAQELKAWWYREMLTTPSPLTERMTLFWHNHFTSALEKVKFTPHLYHQNVTLRANATGNFRSLLQQISVDPAMVVYLDSVSNRRGKPNENFARELLELFTLGEGHYTEADIKQAARAFTGYALNRETGKFQFVARAHDPGTKQFMGRTGEFTGDDVIEVVLANPQSSKFIVKKLWREFVSPNPDPAEVERIAKLFRDENYELKPVLRALFNSKAMHDPANRGTLIKSPAELMVGTLRTLELPVTDTRPLLGFGVQMGQDLFNPPNVKGWPGGEWWINTNRLLVRRQFVERTLNGDPREQRRQMMQQVAMTMEPASEMQTEMQSELQSDAPEMQDETAMQVETQSTPAPIKLAPQPMRQRIAELKAQGLTKEQIKARLRDEAQQGRVYVPPALRQELGVAAQPERGPRGGQAREMILAGNPQLRQKAMALAREGKTPEQIRQALRGDFRKSIEAMAPEDRKERLTELAKQLPMPRVDTTSWLTQAQALTTQGATPSQHNPAQAAQEVLLALPPTQTPTTTSPHDMLLALMLDPVYQLK